jgi:hypothetical protein
MVQGERNWKKEGWLGKKIGIGLKPGISDHIMDLNEQ